MELGKGKRMRDPNHDGLDLPMASDAYIIGLFMFDCVLCTLSVF